MPAAASAVRTRLAATAASGARRAGERRILAAEAPDDVGYAERFARHLGEHLQNRVTGRMAVLIVDRFEAIEIENQHAHGRLALSPPGRHEAFGGFEVAAPVQQPGERIGCGRHAIAMHGPILGEDQYDEGDADDIKNDFDRNRHDPAARRSRTALPCTAQCGNRHRKQKDRAVQHRNEDRRPAADQRFTALATQLHRGQECVDCDDERTDHHVGCGRCRECRKEGRCDPEPGAERHGGPARRPAVKATHPAPGHADGDEHQRRRASRRQCRRQRIAEPPQHAGGAADQIGAAPPRQRPIALLQPGMQQKQPEQDGDAN